MNKSFLAMAILALPILTGCVTLDTPPGGRRVASPEQIEQENQRLQVQRLTERVEGLSAKIERLYADLDTLRLTLEQENQALKSGQAELDRKIKAESQLREQSKQEIVANLSQKIAELLKQTSSSSASASRVSGGWEHTVQSGENLSQIAALYNSSVQAVVRANKLSSPDMIRVGQKLFIPE